MGYPMRGYRNALSRAARRGGSQGRDVGSIGRRFGVPDNLPVPANDNFYGVPANDNEWTEPLLDLAEKYILPEAEKDLPKVAPRLLPRLLPWIGFGLAAYDAYRWWQNHNGHALVGAPITAFPVPSQWTLNLSCGLVGDYASYVETFNTCGTSVVGGPGTDKRPSTTAAATYTTFKITGPYLTTPFSRADNKQKWIRSGGSYRSTDLPYTGAVYADNPVGVQPFPNVNPASRPIMAGMQADNFGPQIPWGALPYTGGLPGPDATQSYQSYQGPTEQPKDDPANHIRGSATTLLDTSTGSRTATDTAPEHGYKRPPDKTREKKFAVTPSNKLLVMRAFNALTEVDDFVDDLFWSVKGSKKFNRQHTKFWKDPTRRWHKSGPSIQDKALFIYRNYHDIDVPQAVRNVINDQWKDFVYGKLGRLNAKAARNVHDKGYGSPSRTYTVSRSHGFSPRLPVPDLV